MKPEEEHAKKTFLTYLADRIGLYSATIKEGKEPPDYFLTINDQEYALEITTIMLNVTLGSKNIPEFGYVSFIDEIEKEIEAEAKKRGILDGTYLICSFGPFKKLSKSKIKDNAIEYIKKHQNIEKGHWQTIYKEGDRKIEILKVGTASKLVDGGSISPDFSLRWRENIPKEACIRLEVCLKDKYENEKLRKVRLPIISVLYNEYFHSSTFYEIYRQCRINPVYAEYFHAIFIAEKDGSGYFIHNKEKYWQD